MPQIFEAIDVTKGDMLRIAEGREAMKLFIDTRKKEEILKIIPRNRLFGIRESLGEVNISFAEGKEDQPGLLSTILNELAINNINIIDTISTGTESIFIIKEGEISKAHDILLKFFYGGANEG
jgi:hypothetical protein